MTASIPPEPAPPAPGTVEPSGRSVLIWICRLILVAGVLSVVAGIYYFVLASRVGSSEDAGQLAYVAMGVGGLGLGVVAMLIGGGGAAWLGRPRAPNSNEKR